MLKTVTLNRLAEDIGCGRQLVLLSAARLQILPRTVKAGVGNGAVVNAVGFTDAQAQRITQDIAANPPKAGRKRQARG